MVVHAVRPGCGKTHLATSLGVAAITAGQQRVLHDAAGGGRVAAPGPQENRHFQPARLGRGCVRQQIDDPIVDEIGYLPLIREGRRPVVLPTGQLLRHELREGPMVLTIHHKVPFESTW